MTDPKPVITLLIYKGYIRQSKGNVIMSIKSKTDWTALQGKNRPQCSVPGCNNGAVAIRICKQTGIKAWRRSSWILEKYPEVKDNWCCSRCHDKNIAKKHGTKTRHHLTASRHGLTLTEYQERIHPYLIHRKDYCENIDGRLGFVCNSAYPTRETLDKLGFTDWGTRNFLDVDHKDGNSSNHDPENLQTLCKNCHKLKTYSSGDHLTVGRTTCRRQKDEDPDKDNPNEYPRPLSPAETTPFL